MWKFVTGENFTGAFIGDKVIHARRNLVPSEVQVFCNLHKKGVPTYQRRKHSSNYIFSSHVKEIIIIIIIIIINQTSRKSRVSCNKRQSLKSEYGLS
jgi:hypothetical protein